MRKTNRAKAAAMCTATSNKTKRTTKSERTCGGIGRKKNTAAYVLDLSRFAHSGSDIYFLKKTYLFNFNI